MFKRIVGLAWTALYTGRRHVLALILFIRDLNKIKEYLGLETN